ncbi:hypothetical protein PsorP6_009888 [Peronosclerospora sorghi]|uniref:Uncharacterized protein n=1 Tax=Peronosclerospora sorghi TaxID=230839 RepID=A0ACC0W2G1_9STRA|nr:hypothetical protein PsorP6_009888 [Peronosclerospora sorghi]
MLYLVHSCGYIQGLVMNRLKRNKSNLAVKSFCRLNAASALAPAVTARKKASAANKVRSASSSFNSSDNRVKRAKGDSNFVLLLLLPADSSYSVCLGNVGSSSCSRKLNFYYIFALEKIRYVL